jgi:GH24 family phage-related lysozyme (muramidase)
MVTEEDTKNLARQMDMIQDLPYMFPPTQTEKDAAADALISPELNNNNNVAGISNDLNRVPYQAESIPLQGNIPPILEGTPSYNVEKEYAENKYQAILNGTYTPTDEERRNPYLITKFMDDYKGKIEERPDILADLKNYAQNIMSSANYFNKKEMEEGNITTPRIIRELERVLPADLQAQVKEFLYGNESSKNKDNLKKLGSKYYDTSESMKKLGRDLYDVYESNTDNINMLKDVAGKPNKYLSGLYNETKKLSPDIAQFITTAANAPNEYLGGFYNETKAMADKPSNTMNTYMDFLKKEEGFRAEPYKLPGEEFNTIGFGHYGSDVQDGLKITERQANNILRNDIEIRLEQITNAIPNFEGFKLNDRKHLLGSWFRGGLAGSPNTIALINEGKYKEAAKEFLDNDEYRNKKTLPGVKKRMRATAKAISRLK